MAFTVEDFQDLLELLRAHPEWRQRLWELLASEELLRLPAEVKAFREEFQAFRDQTFETFRQETEQRFRPVEEQIAALRQEFLEHRQESLELRREVASLKNDVGVPKDNDLKRWYRELAHTDFGQARFRKVYVLSTPEVIGGLGERPGCWGDFAGGIPGRPADRRRDPGPVGGRPPHLALEISWTYDYAALVRDLTPFFLFKPVCSRSALPPPTAS